MNNVALTELVKELEHLLLNGTDMSMLVMTVKNSSNGLLAGKCGSELCLDYPKSGWLDIFRSNRFLSFCKRNNFAVNRVKWGSEHVIRAGIGSNPANAANTIDSCFTAVYGESGPFGLKISGIGWEPSNKALNSQPSAAGTPQSGAP